MTEDIFGVLGRWSPAAGARTLKFDCIITLNLCLLRRYIVDILHRGLATTQAIRYFHSNRSRGNLFTLVSKTYRQFGKICFKLDYRFTLLLAFLISVYKSLYLFLSLWLGRAHTSPSPPPLPPTPSRHLSGIYHFVLEKLQMPHGGAGRSYIYENPTVGLKNTVQMPYPGTTPKLHFREVPYSNSY